MMDQTGFRPSNGQHHLLFCNFCFVRCCGVSMWYNQWADHPRFLRKIHFSSLLTIRSTDRSLRVSRRQVIDISKRWCLQLSFNSCRIHLSTFWVFSSFVRFSEAVYMRISSSSARFWTFVCVCVFVSTSLQFTIINNRTSYTTFSIYDLKFATTKFSKPLLHFASKTLPWRYILLTFLAVWLRYVWVWIRRSRFVKNGVLEFQFLTYETSQNPIQSNLIHNSTA